MEIRIYNRTNKTYRYRKELSEMGFFFESNYWKKECSDEDEISKIEYFCKRNGLEFAPVIENYTRGTHYRSDFFKHNKGIFGNYKIYHCAYCGKIQSYKKITVDHLIPVNKVLHGKHKKYWRKRLKRMMINDVNDYRNLVPACKRCNSKKGTKTGFWILRGKVGKNFGFWLVYKPIKIATIIGFMVFVFQYFQWGEIIQIAFGG